MGEGVQKSVFAYFLCMFSVGKVWFCYGDQHIGRLSSVSCEQSTMCTIDYKVSVVCVWFIPTLFPS